MVSFLNGVKLVASEGGQWLPLLSKFFRVYACKVFVSKFNLDSNFLFVNSILQGFDFRMLPAPMLLLKFSVKSKNF